MVPQQQGISVIIWDKENLEDNEGTIKTPHRV
jgi:hypothetical protein